MAASATRMVPYNGMTIDDCAAKIRYVLFNLRWNIYREVPGAIFASVPLSFWSWGENLTINFYQNGFQITSECSFPLTIIDWGKNNKNIDQFLTAFYA